MFQQIFRWVPAHELRGTEGQVRTPSLAEGKPTVRGTG